MHHSKMKTPDLNVNLVRSILRSGAEKLPPANNILQYASNESDLIKFINVQFRSQTHINQAEFI